MAESPAEGIDQGLTPGPFLTRSDNTAWLASLPLPAIQCNRTGALLTANDAACDLLGLPVDDASGLDLATMVHPGSRARLNSALEQVHTEPVHVEVGLVTPGGTVAGRLLVFADGAGETVTLVVEPPEGSSATTAVSVESVAHALVTLCDVSVAEREPRALLSSIAGTILAAVPVIGSLSLELGSPAEPYAVASAGPRAATIDGWQIQAQEGPCVQAWETGLTVRTRDLASDPRWPMLARLADGAIPAIAVPVSHDGTMVGVLNCYDADPESPDPVLAAELLASATGALLAGIEEREALRVQGDQLRFALTSRAVIDQAKGIVMAHRGVDADEAFAYLARLSQDRNVKVRDLAAAIVEQAASRTEHPDVTGS